MLRSLSILLALALIALALPALAEKAPEAEAPAEMAAAEAVAAVQAVERAAPAELPAFDLESLMTPDPEAAGGCTYQSWCDTTSCGSGKIRWCEFRTNCTINCGPCGNFC